MLAQRCLDLLVPRDAESALAELKRAGVSVGAWRGRACMCGPSPPLAVWSYGYGKVMCARSSASGNTGETSSTSPHAAASAQPHRRALLRAHITLYGAHILWRAQTWHAGKRARTYPFLRRDVGTVLQQRLHHRRVPALGGVVQAGPPELESRRALSGATRTPSSFQHTPSISTWPGSMPV